MRAAVRKFLDSIEPAKRKAATFAWRAVQLLSDSAFAGRVGLAGQEYVRAHHSWERAAARFEALYAGQFDVDSTADGHTVAKVA